MQTLILPGYSASNKEWVDETAKSLKVEGTIRPFYWMHWTDENSKFDVQEKAELIAKHLRGEKANIVAKSIGTLVASILIKINPEQINKVIFCGIPVKDVSNDELELIRSVCQTLGDKITIIQNSNDPHGTFDEVKDFGNVIMTDRDDHNYPFVDKFNRIF
jgi:pimeloyl-ACP methyl ester carboxylesterase